MWQKMALIGRLTRDPETRNAGSAAVTVFGVAVNERWKDKSGEDQERVEFFNCQAWGNLGTKVVAKYLRKGSLVFLEGRFRSNKWKDKEGVERVGMTINVDTLKMLDGKRGGDDESESTGYRKPPKRGEEEQPDLSTYSGGRDEDIPF